MENLINKKKNFVIAVSQAKEVARLTGKTQMVYVYNDNAGDWSGHHVSIEKTVDDVFKNDKKLDFVKEVIAE